MEIGRVALRIIPLRQAQYLWNKPGFHTSELRIGVNAMENFLWPGSRIECNLNLSTLLNWTLNYAKPFHPCRPH